MQRSSPAPRLLTLAKYLVVLAMFIAGALVYSSLPAIMPSHWGYSGEADGWMPRERGAWFVPAIALLMAVLFPLLSKLDPKEQNYPLFQKSWAQLQLAIVAMMAYVYGVQIYASLHPGASALVGRLIVLGMGLLFISIGNLLGKIRQNFFIGLRTPWSLSDPEIWQRSQRFGGWAFVLGGVLIVLEAILWVWVPVAFFVILGTMVLLPIVYSYVIYQQKMRR